MHYRKFGKTGKEISVITLGGMRYNNSWQDPRDVVSTETLDQCANCVKLAFKHGINHIETAHGYGKSEHCYGRVLNDILAIPRKNYFLMTKGAPQTGAETRAFVEAQLKALKTDHIDFYGYHGINNRAIFENACATGGPVEALVKLKDEGIIGHVGFSTHGPLDVIQDAIATNLFDFVNLHYYYFFQRNRPAVESANARNMGVFIISPNDKGGLLYKSPTLLKNITEPLTPIQWNARFCLSTPQAHTLSFGMTEPSHFEEMAGICSQEPLWGAQEIEILNALTAQRSKDSYSSIDGYAIDPGTSGINIPEILRFRTMWKCWNMTDWCDYRYNMFQEKDHWFPGVFATDENIAKIPDASIPKDFPLKDLLREFHKKFYKGE